MTTCSLRGMRWAGRIDHFSSLSTLFLRFSGCTMHIPQTFLTYYL